MREPDRLEDVHGGYLCGIGDNISISSSGDSARIDVSVWHGAQRKSG